jgi:IclR family pca regulon transcriptional regulator
VLLAALPKTQLTAWLRDRPLARFTAHTTVDARAFRTLIDQVRTQDYCEADQVHELGIHALAVPLRDARGRTVAALNAVVGTARAQEGALRREVLPLLLEAARELRPLI